MTGRINRVAVEILGEQYIIKGSADSEHICEVSNYLTKKIDEMQLRNPHLSAKRIAILASFNMADELLRLKKDYTALVQLLDKNIDMESDNNG